tara:strand:+ start:297 stop:1286 length:990 start_codon:yes stop_codon:yes gene_type:complete
MKSTPYAQIIKTFNNGICFAHVAYELEKAFKIRNTGIQFNQYWDFESLKANINKVEVLTISGLWDNNLLDEAKNLKFIQSIGAGYDQFDLKALKSRGIKLANASGCNKNAVSEHAISMILSLTRLLHHGRDNQKKHFWRPMISDSTIREDELENKTMLLIGLGQIGSRISKIAKAFGMNVIAIRQNPKLGKGTADEIHPISSLNNLIHKADFLVLACPLTQETKSIVDSNLLSKMKKTSHLINVARGGCVNDQDLLHSLRNHEISGAGIDHFNEDPLSENSPFWDLDNIIITPHSAGETRMYEENIIDILLENLSLLSSGNQELKNGVV